MSNGNIEKVEDIKRF